MAVSLLFGTCNDGGTLLSKGIESINIFAVTTAGQEKVATVDDKKLLAELAKSINHSRREPVKFRANYALEIKYKGEVRRVLVNGRYINIDGLTYSMEEDLEAKLKLIVANPKR
jgi:hypothetical protein